MRYREVLELVQPHWEAAIAAAAALGSAAIAGDATKKAGQAQAGALAVPKPNPQGYTPSAKTLAEKPGVGASLTGSYAATQPVAQPERVSQALGATDLSAGAGAPPPIGAQAPAPIATPGTPPTAAPIGAGSAAPAEGGNAGPASEKPSTLQNAQLVGSLASTAAGLLQGPQLQGGGIPQPGPVDYSPTSGLAAERLRQMLALRRPGYGGY